MYFSHSRKLSIITSSVLSFLFFLFYCSVSLIEKVVISHCIFLSSMSLNLSSFSPTSYVSVVISRSFPATLLSALLHESSPPVYLDYCLTYRANISFQGISSFKNSHFPASCDKLTFISNSFVHKAHDAIVKCFPQMQQQ